jgi:hypothetical protein
LCLRYEFASQCRREERARTGAFHAGCSGQSDMNGPIVDSEACLNPTTTYRRVAQPPLTFNGQRKAVMRGVRQESDFRAIRDTAAPPAPWWQHVIQDDVMVWVRGDVSPWRMKQIRAAIDEMASRLREPESSSARRNSR